jgi:hypothetical protein
MKYLIFVGRPTPTDEKLRACYGHVWLANCARTCLRLVRQVEKLILDTKVRQIVATGKLGSEPNKSLVFCLRCHNLSNFHV